MARLLCRVLCCGVLAVGCDRQAPVLEAPPVAASDSGAVDAGVAKISGELWKSQTAIIKKHEAFIETSPEDWLATAAARSARMLTIGNHPDPGQVVSISLDTDAEFWAKTQPEDIALLTVSDCQASYVASLEYAAAQLRARGIDKDAASVEKLRALFAQ